MKYLISLFFLMFSPFAFADVWLQSSSVYLCSLSEATSASIDDAHLVASDFIPGPNYDSYEILGVRDTWTRNTTPDVCPSYVQYRVSHDFVLRSSVTDSDLSSTQHFGVIYTDSQCESLYGTGSTSTGVPGGSNDSSCHIPPPTDEYCQALDPVNLTVPKTSLNLLDGQNISAGGCSWQLDSAVTVCVDGTGECLATYSPIGAAPDAPASSADLPEMPADLDTGWASGDENYTETTDPAADCPWNNVSDGTTTYCYSGAHANTGDEYPDGSIRVDYGDGSYAITDMSGTTTTYNPDGTLKEQSTAPTTPGTGPSGDGTEGSEIGLLQKISDRISDLISTTDQGFSDLEDSLTEEAPDTDIMIGDSNLDELSAQVDQEAEAHTDNVIDKLDEIGDGDSSTIAEQVTGTFPDLPSSSCTPLTFGAPPFEFTISCDVFEKIRTWFGWIIYFWTAVSIIDLFFSPATRRA